MKKTIAAVIASIAMLLGMVVVATPANAALTGLCWVGGDQTARLSGTKWDSSFYSGGTYFQSTTYHLDLNSSSNGKYHASALYIDGVKQTSWNDVYFKTGAPVGHSIRGRWWYYYGEGTAYTYCSFYL